MLGSWYNDAVAFAVLPELLNKGTIPEPYSAGGFPVYQNLEAVTATLQNTFIHPEVGLFYQGGRFIFLDFTDQRNILTNKSVVLNDTNDFTLTLFVDINDVEWAGEPHSAGYLLGANTDNANRIFMLGNTIGTGAIQALVLPAPADTLTIIPSYAIQDVKTIHLRKNGTSLALALNGEIGATTAYTKGAVTYVNPFYLGWDGTALNVYQRYQIQTLGFIWHNEALSDGLLARENALGPSLGGNLVGYDNGDGTMLIKERLSDIENMFLAKKRGAA